MDQQRQQLVEKLKSANNILVTVSSNPSVDQLAAAIGLTLLLNKLKKHATAVFSGQAPSAIEFLKPEETLEKTTDSLRDFIISLDKSKADKLRYKVEDNVVRIFITPYRTSITQDDLNFSQGDFNVDVVVAIGVNAQQDLDQAIVAHGRILHDAAVTTINTRTGGELGSINYVDPAASSLSELTTEIATDLGKDLLDGQMATAFLTGIVAETERFSNEKTSPETMRLSAELMSAGANQQLVASSLQVTAASQPAQEQAPGVPAEATHKPDGTLEISHHTPDEQNQAAPAPANPAPENTPDIHVTDDGRLVLSEGASTPGSTPTDNAAAVPAPEPAPMPEPPKPEVLRPDTAEEPDGISLLPPSQSPKASFMMEPPHSNGSMPSNTSPADPDRDGAAGSDGNMYDALMSQSNDEPKPESEPETHASTGRELRIEVPTETESESESKSESPAPNNAAATSPAAAPPEVELKTAEPAPAAAPIIAPEIALPPVVPTEPITPASEDTLDSIEKMLHSPHVEPEAPVLNTPASSFAPPPVAPLPATPATTPAPAAPLQDVDAARDAVLNAINSVPNTEALPPKESVGASGYLNVQDLPDLDDAGPAPMSTLPLAAAPTMPQPQLSPIDAVYTNISPADRPLDMPLPPSMSAMPQPLTPAPAQAPSGMPAPPPVPPPMTQLPPIN